MHLGCLLMLNLLTELPYIKLQGNAVHDIDIVCKCLSTNLIQYEDGEEEEGAEEGEYDEDADPDYNPGVSTVTL